VLLLRPKEKEFDITFHFFVVTCRHKGSREETKVQLLFLIVTTKIFPKFNCKKFHWETQQYLHFFPKKFKFNETLSSLMTLNLEDHVFTSFFLIPILLIFSNLWTEYDDSEVLAFSQIMVFNHYLITNIRT
jgi:hypothetical protein